MPLLDLEVTPQPLDISHQVPRGVLASLGVGPRLPTSTLVQQDNAVLARVEEGRVAL